MPELPDIVVYIERLRDRVLDQRLEKVRLASPFLVRSFDPPIQEAEGKKVVELRRLGKRIIFCLESELFLIFHLMIAGRLRWRAKSSKIPGKLGLAAASALAVLLDGVTDFITAQKSIVICIQPVKHFRTALPFLL